MPGAYNRAIGAIENLKQHGPDVNIVLNAIFSPEDPFQCLHTVELARKFNLYVKVQPLNQHPIFNKENYSTISSAKTIVSHQIQEVAAKLKKEKRVVNSKIFLDNIHNFFCKKEDLIFRKSPCIYGYYYIEIQEDGTIFPCLTGLDWQNGAKFSGSLKDLLHSDGYRHLLEKLKSCKACRDNYYICYYEPRINFPINNFLKEFFHR
ncbi:MAG: SPASM domain-containing protein [Candidatus Omnitrophica bacterium]|nr:SPASM domain-containing protein [Candidatus Omnitrophota bacterium]